MSLYPIESLIIVIVCLMIAVSLFILGIKQTKKLWDKNSQRRRSTFIFNYKKLIPTSIIWWLLTYSMRFIFNDFLPFMWGFIAGSLGLCLLILVVTHNESREVWNGKEWIKVESYNDEVEQFVS